MGTVEFTKYQATGNDFLVLRGETVAPRDRADLARRLCERRRGVGADGLLLVSRGHAGWNVVVVNADGSVAETSGNGLRCAVAYLLDERRIGPDDDLLLTSGAGPVRARLRAGRITVGMGPPRFQANNLPAGGAASAVAVDLGEITGVAVSMGNPHLVVEVDADPRSVALEALAALAEPHFPDGVNVEIVQVEAVDRTVARVWERGVGETRACGSGACAIAGALASAGRVVAPLRIQMPGGALEVCWQGEMPSELWLSGPAGRVFQGVYP